MSFGELGLSSVWIAIELSSVGFSFRTPRQQATSTQRCNKFGSEVVLVWLEPTPEPSRPTSKVKEVFHPLVVAEVSLLRAWHRGTYGWRSKLWQVPNAPLCDEHCRNLTFFLCLCQSVQDWSSLCLISSPVFVDLEYRWTPAREFA